MSSNGYLAIVEYDYSKLYTVNEIVFKIGLVAVKQNGLALEFVKEQTLELGIEVVKRDSRDSHWVKDKFMLKQQEVL